MEKNIDKSKKKHNIFWEGEEWAKGWLKSISTAPEPIQVASNSTNFSWCVACKTSLKSQKKDLKRHAEATKHKLNFESLFAKNTLQNYGIVTVTTDMKILDIKLAIFTAKHSSISSVDHLTNMLKSLSINEFENLRLHRTKCSAIIKHVIAPVLLNDLVKDIGHCKYSLMVDESTDIARNKWMSICVRYFSSKKCKLITEFLGLFLVEEATADKLFDSLKSYLKQVGLSNKNILSIGTDGANNLCGQRKSLYTYLKNDNPDLILIKCTCHSLHLCCSEASKVFSPDVEFLIKEIYNYFSNSPLRTIKYKRAFDLINTGFNTIKFKKLVQISATRWLSHGLAVKVVLEQWEELKYHFSIIATAECEKTAQIIHELMCREEIRLYLLFMSPILNEMNRLNMDFQSDRIDAGSIYDKLHLSLLSLASKIFKPSVIASLGDEEDIMKITEAMELTTSFLSLDAMDLGYHFEDELKSIDSALLLKVKTTCFLYLKSLLQQMLKRFPSNLKIFKTYKQFSPNNCCNPLGQPKFTSIMKILEPAANNNVPKDIYESQWKKMPFIKWNDLFDTEIITNLNMFWIEVYSYQDASGSRPFKDLAELVLNLLCVSTSNACVERVFSAMNSIKTKIRNKMQYEMLESLLRINIHFKNNGICCDSFNPSPEMVKFFNSKSMYQSNISASDKEDLDSELYDFINQLD